MGNINKDKATGKRPVGRPRMAEEKKAKPISKMIRVPLPIADELKFLASMFKSGLISSRDIQDLIDKGQDGTR